MYVEQYCSRVNIIRFCLGRYKKFVWVIQTNTKCTLKSTLKYIVKQMLKKRNVVFLWGRINVHESLESPETYVNTLIILKTNHKY